VRLGNHPNVAALEQHFLRATSLMLRDIFLLTLLEMKEAPIANSPMRQSDLSKDVKQNNLLILLPKLFQPVR
jgi:hypothetical protein